MRAPYASPAVALALALTACAVCVDGPLNAPDLCQQPLGDAGQPEPGGCWSGDPGHPDPSTLAATQHPGPPHPVLCSLAREYTHSPACVESPGGTEDGIDNDCDGTIDEDQDGNGGHPAPPPVPKSSAFVLPPGHRWTVEANGAGCGRDDCRQGVAEMALHCPGMPRFEGTVTVLPRRDDTCLLAEPGVCGPAAARAHFSSRLVRCNSTVRYALIGWDGHRLSLTGLETTEHRDPPRVDAGPYITDVDALLRCVADAAVEVNTFGDAADTDRDGRHDRCDVCPEDADPEQRDTDGDGLGDACDCVVPEERDEWRCWDAETRAETGGAPGLLTCLDGEVEPSCRSAWPDFATWIDEEILGPGFADGPEAWADYEAVEIEYVHEDGLGNCPPGAMCNANRQQQRGRDYEDWLCRRQRREESRRTQCDQAPLGQRDTVYRTEGLRWALPGELGHEMQQVLHFPEGRVRRADYLVPPRRRSHQTTVLGEAKCYNPFVEWNPRPAWSWYMAVAFGTQLWDYVNKVIASRRTANRYTVVYHFCDFQPRWAAYETAAALAATQAEGFSLRLRDSPPGATWIQSPGCYVDMADMLFTVAPELFECFVPGQIGANPAESCVGSFYDLCSGSE